MGNYVEKGVRRLSYRIGRNIPLNPGISGVVLDRNYDLFVAICQFSADLFALNSIKGWRKQCGLSICLIEEI